MGIIHPEKSTRGNDPVVQTEVSQARPNDLALSLLNESRFLTNHLLWPLSPFAQPPQREKIRDRGKVLSNSVPVNMDSVKNSRIVASKMSIKAGIRVHLRPKLDSLWVKLRVGSQ